MTQSPSIRVHNVRAQHQQIQQKIAHLVQHPSLEVTTNTPLVKTLRKMVAQIEQSCLEQGLTSANLSDQSRQFLAWIKFLLGQHSLKAHVEAVQRVRQLSQAILSPKQKGFKQAKAVHPQNWVIEFTNMQGLYRYTHTLNKVQVQINEGFIVADDAVLLALVKAVLIGKSAATTNVLKRFSVSEEFSEMVLTMDLMVETITQAAKGRVYDLDAVFDEVNDEYFKGQIEKPNLAWSKTLTRRKFGHYEPTRDRIVISLTLDQLQVPANVVAFVMYHEVLHKHHGATWINERRMVHTPAFRQDERQFKQYQQAQAELAKLSRP